MTIRIEQNIGEAVIGDVVLGRNKSFSRSAALNSLPTSRVRGAEGLLAQVLANRDDETKYRRLAAVSMYRMNTPRAREALVQAAGTVTDPVVLAGVVKGLGRIGDESALRAVDAVREQADGALAATAAFAGSMIAHRLGLPGHDLPPPADLVALPDGGLLELAFGRPAAEEVERFTAGMRSEPVGIELDEASLQTFACPGGGWMLAMNRELRGGDAVALLVGRKMMLGVLAARRSEDGRYTPSYFIFSTPGDPDGKARITVTRVSGEPAWAGTASPARRDGAVFSLGTLPGAGITAVEVHGHLSATGDLVFDRGVTSGRVSGKRQPQPLVLHAG